VQIAARYSFNNGLAVIQEHFAAELAEIEAAVQAIRADLYKTKTSREKTMPGRMLYCPRSLNEAFSEQLRSRGWQPRRVKCEYTAEHFAPGFKDSHPRSPEGAFREMDAVKNRVGVEIQLGKYAFMVYNVCAKMTIFHNLDIIDVGIEVVPVHALAAEMSSGVSYFEQFVWDLDHRGVSDIDIPVLILGVSP